MNATNNVTARKKKKAKMDAFMQIIEYKKNEKKLFIE